MVNVRHLRWVAMAATRNRHNVSSKNSRGNKTISAQCLSYDQMTFNYLLVNLVSRTLMYKLIPHTKSIACKALMCSRVAEFAWSVSFIYQPQIRYKTIIENMHSTLLATVQGQGMLFIREMQALLLHELSSMWHSAALCNTQLRSSHFSHNAESARNVLVILLVISEDIWLKLWFMVADKHGAVIGYFRLERI